MYYFVCNAIVEDQNNVIFSLSQFQTVNVSSQFELQKTGASVFLMPQTN